MNRAASRRQTPARYMWATQWRHVRRTMNDKAEMAWRLKMVKWDTCVPGSKEMWNLACDVAYTRAMSGHHKNRLGKIIA